MPLKKKILFINSNTPVPTSRRKLEHLYKQDKYDVQLIYWHRLASLIDMPMTIAIPCDKIFKIDLLEPIGSFIHRVYLYFQFFIKVMKKIRIIKPDALHIENFDIYLLFCGLKFIYPRLKFILDLNDTRLFFLKSPIRPFSKVVLKTIDHVFITSPGYYQFFLKELKPEFPSSTITWVPNAPYAADFNNYLKKNHNGLIIGYFGYLRGKLAITQIVEVLEELNNENIKISILFAGIGIEVPLVIELSQKYKFVKFSGSFDYSNILDLYESVDIIYSVYELDHNKKIHLSCRLSESINCGLPVIVQSSSFQSEYVRTHNIGYSIEYGNKDELKSLLIQLYKNPNDLLEKTNNCNKIIVEHQFESYETKIIEAYNGIFSYE